MKPQPNMTAPIATGRLAAVLGLLALIVAVLLVRAVDLHILNRDFLQQQGDARHLRVVAVPAHRGMITDRHGEPLAISTPVESIWVNPKVITEYRARWPALARTLDVPRSQLERTINQRKDREFVYVARHVPPETAAQVRALDIPGVSLQREYRRYYPTGEVAAHVPGVTNVGSKVWN